MQSDNVRFFGKAFNHTPHKYSRDYMWSMDGAAETCDQVSFFPFCLGDEGKNNAFSLFYLPSPYSPPSPPPPPVPQQNPRCKQNIWQSNPPYNYTRFWKEHAGPRQWLLMTKSPSFLPTRRLVRLSRLLAFISTKTSHAYRRMWGDHCRL